MTSLLFDTNYLFHSEFGVFDFISKSKSGPFVTERDESHFMGNVANRLFHAINQLPASGQVVCCVDSFSWRKSVDIPGGGYKKSRETDDGSKGLMDKATAKKFYGLIEEFTGIVKSVGIKASKVDGAEGDDLIFAWVNHFTSKGENCIVISGDQDINQVVRAPDYSGGGWCVQWNNSAKRQKLYVPAGWRQGWMDAQVDTQDVFNTDVMVDDRTKMRQFAEFAEFVVVDPEAMLFEKILIGDDGDDVPAVWSYEGRTKKGEPKTIRVTPAKAKLITDAIFAVHGNKGVSLIQLLKEDAFVDHLSGVILRAIDATDGTAERLAVAENLRRNELLMRLSKETIPHNLMLAMEDDIESSLGTAKQWNRWNRKALFEGTRFAAEAPPRASDPFAFFNVPE